MRDNDKKLLSLSHARNIGLKNALHDWVLCMDCDLIIPFDLFRVLSSITTPKNHNIIFWTWRHNVDHINKLNKVKFIDKSPYGYFHFFNRKSVMSKIGGYDEKIYGWGSEDDDFITRAKRGKLKIVCLDKLLIRHVIHEYHVSWKNNEQVKKNQAQLQYNIKNKILKMENVGIPNLTKAKGNFHVQRNSCFKKDFIIFGAGPNIGNINSEKFCSLSERYSTIGFSWFYKSGLIPDYYYCHEESHRSEQCKEIIDFLDKKSQIKKTVFFATAEHIEYMKSHDFYHIPVVEVAIECYKENFWDIETKKPKLDLSKLWAQSLLPPRNKLFLTRSQLESAINLAYILGAKDIILHGVELNDNNHFCETDSSVGKNIFHKELENKVGFNSDKDMHCSTIDFDNCLGIQYIIKEIHEYLKTFGVNLMSSDQNSLLVKEKILPYINIY